MLLLVEVVVDQAVVDEVDEEGKEVDDKVDEEANKVVKEVTAWKSHQRQFTL